MNTMYVKWDNYSRARGLYHVMYMKWNLITLVEVCTM